jgi:hypothetical protein
MVEMFSERSCEDIEQLLRFSRTQWEWMVDLELLQSWHRPQEEIMGWMEHRSRLRPSGHRGDR